MRIPSSCDFTVTHFAVPLQRDFYVLYQTDLTRNNMAKIYVNGEVQEVNLPLNVTALIKQLLVENPEMVSVQVNEEFAERDEWDKLQIQEGDKVDFLYFMGGGTL